MELVCIDFETANSSRGSACSLGIAVFSKGSLKESKEWLVRPHSSLNYFDPFNISIHGIKPGDVASAPEFDKVAQEFFQRLKPGAMVLAHNASFDMSVLRSVLNLYRIPYPEFDYLCTCKASQKVWPQLPSHKLDVVAAHIKHVFKHHNAMEDAEAAGRAMLAMISEAQAESSRDLAKRIGMRPGRIFKGGYSPCSVAKS